MGRWLINQKNDVQFAAENLDELKQLAKDGKLSAGDMVQPPDASEWIYASEIEQIKDLLGADDDTDDFAYKSGWGGTALAGVVAAVFVGIAVVGFGTMWVLFAQFPDPEQGLFEGDGALNYSQMVTTTAPVLRDGPAGDAGTVTTVPKDTTVELLAKRGDFYKIRLDGGQEGWVGITDVLPMYTLGGLTVKEEMDPLYNPDRYVLVSNANWMQLDRKNEQLTVFRFEMQNQSKYEMTDLVLLATIKDSKGNEVTTVEIPIDGIIPPLDRTMVGTLAPDPKDKEAKPQLLTQFSFDKAAEEDPDLQLRYSDGVEVQMEAEDFTEATIDLLELRAAPMTEAAG